MIKGIVRRIDDLGRVVLPKEMRKAMKIENGDPVDMYLENGVITIKPVKLQCVCCGSNEEDKLIIKNEVHICVDCIMELNEEVVE